MPGFSTDRRNDFPWQRAVIVGPALPLVLVLLFVDFLLWDLGDPLKEISERVD